MRHFLSNIISGFILKKSLRDKVRVMIRFPETHDYIRFVKKLVPTSEKKFIHTMVGYGCKNFIVVLNKQKVFKFPLFSDGKDVALREQRIINTFSKISPIKIPKMEILKYKDIYVRQYEYAYGTLLTDVKPQIIMSHGIHIAKQIANFLYVIGKSDPKNLYDLKPVKTAKPGFMYGWFQGDIWQNFMLDTNTFNITFFIDWEDTQFIDFLPSLTVASHNWDKFGYKGFSVPVMAEYAKLYMANSKNLLKSSKNKEKNR